MGAGMATFHCPSLRSTPVKWIPQTDGMTPAHEAFDRLGIRTPPGGDFHTIAGFALARLTHLPGIGEAFSYEGWRFEIVDMAGRRIKRLLARR